MMVALRKEGVSSMSDELRLRIGFLGAGRMATALARGWLNAGLARPEALRAADPVAAAREAFLLATGCAAISDNRQVVANSDILILAVKPQSMTELMAEIKPILGSQLVVSIAAGITLRQLRAGLRSDCRLIRVMPNTPCLVGASASAYS
ncbi:MAG: pyrroline-5-carboxylate reductase family protein, partial [Candidatus Acidiferrum sp.]